MNSKLLKLTHLTKLFIENFSNLDKQKELKTGSSLTLDNLIKVIIIILSDYNSGVVDIIYKSLSREDLIKVINHFLENVLNFPYILSDQYSNIEIIYFLNYFLIKYEIPEDIYIKMTRLSNTLKVKLIDFVNNDNDHDEEKLIVTSTMNNTSNSIIFEYKSLENMMKKLKLEVDKFVLLSNRLKSFKEYIYSCKDSKDLELYKSMRLEEIFLFECNENLYETYNKKSKFILEEVSKLQCQIEVLYEYIDKSRKLSEELFEIENIDLLESKYIPSSESDFSSSNPNEDYRFDIDFTEKTKEKEKSDLNLKKRMIFIKILFKIETIPEIKEMVFLRMKDLKDESTKRLSLYKDLLRNEENKNKNDIFLKNLNCKLTERHGKAEKEKFDSLFDKDNENVINNEAFYLLKDLDFSMKYDCFSYENLLNEEILLIQDSVDLYLNEFNDLYNVFVKLVDGEGFRLYNYK